MTLEGSYLSPTFSFIRIRLYPCDEYRDAYECATDDEIREYFDDQDLNYFYTNTYYDQTEYPENHEVSDYIESQECFMHLEPGI
jgi:hypothetical protein